MCMSLILSGASISGVSVSLVPRPETSPKPPEVEREVVGGFFPMALAVQDADLGPQQIFANGKPYVATAIKTYIEAAVVDALGDANPEITYTAVRMGNEFFGVPNNIVQNGRFTYDPVADTISFTGFDTFGYSAGVDLIADATVVIDGVTHMQSHVVTFFAIGMPEDVIPAITFMYPRPIESAGFTPVHDVDPSDPSYDENNHTFYLPHAVEYIFVPFEEGYTFYIGQDMSGAASYTDVAGNQRNNLTDSGAEFSFTTDVTFRGSGNLSEDGYFNGVFISDQPETDEGVIEGTITITIAGWTKTYPLTYELIR